MEGDGGQIHLPILRFSDGGVRCQTDGGAQWFEMKECVGL